jgi:hypothetical protein
VSDAIMTEKQGRAIKSSSCSGYNEGMTRVIILILAVASLFGQTPPATPDKAPTAPESAPSEVDAALRARVTQFYQFEVDQKFSQAYRMVADDTKDLFIGSSKPSYLSFELKSIRYYDDFTKAEVMLLVNRLLPIQGFMGHPLPTRMNSRWKVENGEWCFFVDPQRDMPVTPFGGLPVPGGAVPGGAVPGAVMPTRTPAATPGGGPTAPPPLPSHIADPRLLTADKNSVKLKSSGESSDQVTISNTSPWIETLTVSDPKVAGLTIKLSHPTISPSQKAVVTISSSGAVQVPNKPIMIAVTVGRTKQNIPIQVSFTN